MSLKRISFRVPRSVKSAAEYPLGYCVRTPWAEHMTKYFSTLFLLGRLGRRGRRRRPGMTKVHPPWCGPCEDCMLPRLSLALSLALSLSLSPCLSLSLSVRVHAGGCVSCLERWALDCTVRLYPISFCADALRIAASLVTCYLGRGRSCLHHSRCEVDYGADDEEDDGRWDGA